MIRILTFGCFAIFVSACMSSSLKKLPASRIVEIKGMQFHPANLSVDKGDTVVFVNNDFVVHDVTEKSKAWNSNPIPVGQSFKMVIANPVEYYCSFHPIMKGQIIMP